MLWQGRVWLAGMALWFAGCGSTPVAQTEPQSERVVVYCAQDREFAEGLFGRFTLQVVPKFDTESTKSVALVEELRREKDRPRCDVHWNNEIVGTIRLARLGLLEPYASPQAEKFPVNSRPADRTWQAFATRARVILVNKNRLPQENNWPQSILQLAQPQYRGQVAMAKPLFGTTATHAAYLFECLGSEKAEQFFRDLQANGVQIVAGNKQVAEGVGQGQFALGLTDTDDAMAEVNANRPVAVIFPDAQGNSEYPRLGTLFIPNTLALIRGGPNPAAGRRLIDYLLSPESERSLAEGGGYQFPLNPEVQAALPPALAHVQQVRRIEVDFEKVADLWDQSQVMMRQLFAK